MAGWKEVITHLTNDIEGHMDRLRYRLYYHLGGPSPIKIVTYRGYGSPERLYLRGRVLEDKHIPEAEANDNLWENLVNMYKRMESDEIPHARLMARFEGVEQEVIANEEGYFEVLIEPKNPLPTDTLWHNVHFELLSPQSEDQKHTPVTAVGEVLVPPPTAKFIIVSDIDDTVLQSDATHMIKMARNVFLGNAHTRLPFPGVAALYRALFNGKTGAEMNPPFFVSSSPWNMYDLLSQFFNLQSIPLGPVLFLRDWGVSETEILPTAHRAYKTDTIAQMLSFYPNMPFILIGDSGQEDPEIYTEIVSRFPKRILAVYIRNVIRDMKRPEAVNALAKKVVEAGSALVLADDSLAIAKHAVEIGLIDAASLPAIQEEKQKDEVPATPIEKLLGKETDAEGKKVVEPPVVVISEETPTETKAATEQGAIQEAVQEAGKTETKQAPTVVVEGSDPTGKVEDAKDDASLKDNPSENDPRD